MKDLVPNAPLREAVEASDASLQEIAERCGWINRGRGDVARLKRTLGMTRTTNGKGKVTVAARCEYKNAVLIARAVGVDPYEVGV